LAVKVREKGRLLAKIAVGAVAQSVRAADS
jgi:hypothetical protein